MKKGEKSRSIHRIVAALSVALGFGIALGLGPGCIVVEEDTCLEGEVVCNGDFIDECYGDTWVIAEDCFDLCGGTCVYAALGPACAC